MTTTTKNSKHLPVTNILEYHFKEYRRDFQVLPTGMAQPVLRDQFMGWLWECENMTYLRSILPSTETTSTETLVSRSFSFTF